MIDRAMYASITELNFLSINSQKKSNPTKKAEKKEKITSKLDKKKWHKNLGHLIKSFTAGLFLF